MGRYFGWCSSCRKRHEFPGAFCCQFFETFDSLVNETSCALDCQDCRLGPTHRVLNFGTSSIQHGLCCQLDSPCPLGLNLSPVSLTLGPVGLILGLEDALL